MNVSARRRFIAEWEAQAGVLLAWPHARTDWAPHLAAAQRTYLAIIRQITRFENVLLVGPEVDEPREALRAAGVPAERVCIQAVPTNDTWARDYGPITAIEDQQLVLVDFTFRGWGGKYAAELDNRVNRRLHAAGAFGATPLDTADFELEGGSIETDGHGTLLTTATCLLNPNRGEGRTRAGVEDVLRRTLGIHRTLWIESGHLEGDDTDAHVDTLARLGPDDTILYVTCPDSSDPHFESLRELERELRGFRTAEGSPYRLVPLPWPEARVDEEGRRLPATYANYLVINGAVLVPTYGDAPADAKALTAVGKVFPDREMVGVDCSTLILQHGSLHCVTMQLPKGTLPWSG